MFDYWCVQMVYTEILVFQNRVISKNVYEIVHVCPPHTAHFDTIIVQLCILNEAELNR